LNAAVTTTILPVSVTALVLAASLGGIGAVAWVTVASLVLSLVVLSVFVARRVQISVRRQSSAVLPAVMGAVPGWIAARLVSDALMPANPLLALICAAAAGTVAYAIVVVAAAPQLPAETIRQLRRAVGSSATPAVPGP